MVLLHPVQVVRFCRLVLLKCRPPGGCAMDRPAFEFECTCQLIAVSNAFFLPLLLLNYLIEQMSKC